jgi:hypothetical protein
MDEVMSWLTFYKPRLAVFDAGLHEPDSCGARVRGFGAAGLD